MSMGSVLYMTGRIRGTDLGGLYKSMPKTTILCIVGAASISAFPLFSGFVAKSLIMAAVLKQGYDWIWLLLLFASAGVFHHAGIKIPYFAFFAHDSGIRTGEPPKNMLLAMTIAAVLCVGIGIYPVWLYDMLPFEVGYNPYYASHVLTQTQLLFFSALAFAWLNLQGVYPPELVSTNLDAEWLYRRFLPNIVDKVFTFVDGHARALRTRTEDRISWLISYFAQRHYPTGKGAVIRPTGSMVMYIAILLATYLWLLLSFPS